MKEFKMEELQEDLLLSLHTRFPNTIDDYAILHVDDISLEKGKAHGCIYSGNASITNDNKKIKLDFGIWFSVYCQAYSEPNIRPDIESYLTGKYGKIQEISDSAPDLTLKAAILLDIHDPKLFEEDPKKRKYFDSNWYVFYTNKGNAILSKRGWFGTYVYDDKLVMRPATDNDWINLGDGIIEIKEGLKIVHSVGTGEDLVKDFIEASYYENTEPNMYVKL